MTWIVLAVVVAGVIFFLFSGSKNKSSSKVALPPSSGNPTEDSRVLLDGLVQENRKRWTAMPDSMIVELIDAQRRDIDPMWDYAYNSAISDGKDAAFAKQVALLKIASFLITGEDKIYPAFSEGLVLETVPFRGLPNEQAKAATVEYCISKYNAPKANPEILLPALLAFADKTFQEAETRPDADAYIYEMIYRETLDWQKYLAQALSDRQAGKA